MTFVFRCAFNHQFILLGDSLDIHSWSDYKENVVGFNICAPFFIGILICSLFRQ